MSTLFLPSCKIRRFCGPASKQLEAYINERMAVQTLGCCKVFCGSQQAKACEGDTALVVCNNCATFVEESSVVSEVRFVWELIDADPAFAFPDYRGQRMAVQDCWRAYEKRDVQEAVRSLMRKMNIEVVELPEHHEHTRFCGLDLLEPCSALEKRFAPQRYVVEGAGMYTPLPEDEQLERLRAHCAGIDAETVVCYCFSCLEGIRLGGKNAVHLIDLLFPSDWG